MIEFDKRYKNNDHRKRSRSTYFKDNQFYSDSHNRASGIDLNSSCSSLRDKPYSRTSPPSSSSGRHANIFRSPSSSSQTPSGHCQYSDEIDVAGNKSKTQHRQSSSVDNFGAYELFKSKSPFKEFTREERNIERIINNSPFKYLNSMDERQDGDQHNMSSSRYRNIDRDELCTRFSRSRSPPRNVNFMTDDSAHNINEKDDIFSTRNPQRDFHEKNGLGRNLYDLNSRRINYINERQNRDDAKGNSFNNFGSFQAYCPPARELEGNFNSFGLLTNCDTANYLSNLENNESLQNINNFTKPSSKIVGYERSKTTAFSSGKLDKDSGNLNLEHSTSTTLMEDEYINEPGWNFSNLSPSKRENSAFINIGIDGNATDILESTRNKNISMNLACNEISNSLIQSQNQLNIPKTVTASKIIPSIKKNYTSSTSMEIDFPNQNISPTIKIGNTSNINSTFIWKSTTSPTLTEISNIQSQNISPKIEYSTSPPLNQYNTQNSMETQYKKPQSLPKIFKVSKSNIPQDRKVIEILSRFKLTAQKLQNLTAQELKALEDYVSLQDQSKVKEIMLRESKRERNICIDVLKRKLADYTVIKSGLKEPSDGHLKAKPKEYWTKWWSLYKYIENAVNKFDPESVYPSLHITKDLTDAEFEAYKKKNLNSSVSKINRNLNVNELRYPYVDSFRFFDAKKLLEDPKFQQGLNSRELLRVQKALSRLEDKPKLAYVHQSLICRWHASLDIVKRANNGELVKFRSSLSLLKNRLFNYLVFESIQELKTMCQEDWPGFDEFYKNLKVEEFESSSIALLHQNDSQDFGSSDDDDEDDIDVKDVKI